MRPVFASIDHTSYLMLRRTGPGRLAQAVNLLLRPLTLLRYQLSLAEHTFAAWCPRSQSAAGVHGPMHWGVLSRPSCIVRFSRQTWAPPTEQHRCHGGRQCLRHAIQLGNVSAHMANVKQRVSPIKRPSLGLAGLW